MNVQREVQAGSGMSKGRSNLMNRLESRGEEEQEERETIGRQ